MNALAWIRRIAALLMLAALVLPQKSCVSEGLTQIYYPLSNAGAWWEIALIAAFFVLPALLLVAERLAPRLRLLWLPAGIAVCAGGLYLISWGSSVAATQLLAGWYCYTGGATLYLGASLPALWQQRQRADRRPDSADH